MKNRFFGHFSSLGVDSPSGSHDFYFSMPHFLLLGLNRELYPFSRCQPLIQSNMESSRGSRHLWMAIMGTANIAKLSSFLYELSWSDTRRQGETLLHWQGDRRLLHRFSFPKPQFLKYNAIPARNSVTIPLRTTPFNIQYYAIPARNSVFVRAGPCKTVRCPCKDKYGTPY